MRIIGIILVIMLVIGALQSCSDDKAPKVSRADKMCSDQGYAWVMSNNFVKRQLKAPSTADFPYKPDAYSYLGDCRHSIVGSVDSQNSFGAMIRTTFSVTMVYQKNDNKWRAENLALH
ncbi:hypothetical protein QAO71_10395 [Halopseudomonas sp. SMJS2]|uniref:hypothetical protein n=1 Tax=Halopseudomonas sp. SMJS2 TaxID=3041098 RepID=UPI0024536869|nr:hypothetical protein [Halopseudomonas sp. SMJS2]WGK60502.1 hypothetical protein QAO71_10395 [Halopseudomonas sp. SMJS2]